MENISKVTEIGICVGCGGCSDCEHITFENNKFDFPAPVVDDACNHCGVCLSKCIFYCENND